VTSEQTKVQSVWRIWAFRGRNARKYPCIVVLGRIYRYVFHDSSVAKQAGIDIKFDYLDFHLVAESNKSE